MTTRERVHRAFQASLKGAPSCAGVIGDVNHPSVSHSWLCDALVEEFEPADPAMPPPDVIESMARACRSCGECGEAPPCATCMAGGVCTVECRCGEVEDGSDEADELDYQEDDAR